MNVLAIKPDAHPASRASRPWRTTIGACVVALGAALSACSGGGKQEMEDRSSADDIAARLSVQGAVVITGEAPLPSLDPLAPVLSSDEQRIQTTAAPADVPLDVTVDALGGVAALLVRVQDANGQPANRYFRVDMPPETPASGAKELVAKALFLRRVVLQIPGAFSTPRFCVDVAGVDQAARVSNYQRFCFVLPANDAAGSNQPFANAGGQKAAAQGTTVTLDGSGSASADGTPLASFAWTQVSGSAVTLQNANTAVAQFVAPDGGGEQVFQLTVTDNANRSASNQTRVDLGVAPRTRPIGSWVLTSNGDGTGTPRIVLTFLPDGTYVKAGIETDPDCDEPGTRAGGSGAEYASFDYDTSAATFQATQVRFENDGSCGLNEPGQAMADSIPLRIEGDRLIIVDDENPDESLILVPAPTGPDIAGSWRIDDSSFGPYIVTFFADGTYLVSNASGALCGAGPDLEGGTEAGSWSVDGAGVLTTAQTVDTECADAATAAAVGLSGFNGAQLGVVSGQLVLDDGAGGIFFFNRLPSGVAPGVPSRTPVPLLTRDDVLREVGNALSGTLALFEVAGLVQPDRSPGNAQDGCSLSGTTVESQSTATRSFPFFAGVAVDVSLQDEHRFNCRTPDEGAPAFVFTFNGFQESGFSAADADGTSYDYRSFGTIDAPATQRVSASGDVEDYLVLQGSIEQRSTPGVLSGATALSYTFGGQDSDGAFSGVIVYGDPATPYRYEVTAAGASINGAYAYRTSFCTGGTVAASTLAPLVLDTLRHPVSGQYDLSSGAAGVRITYQADGSAAYQIVGGGSGTLSRAEIDQSANDGC